MAPTTDISVFDGWFIDRHLWSARFRDLNPCEYYWWENWKIEFMWIIHDHFKNCKRVFQLRIFKTKLLFRKLRVLLRDWKSTLRESAEEERTSKFRNARGCLIDRATMTAAMLRNVIRAVWNSALWFHSFIQYFVCRQVQSLLQNDAST